LNQLLGTYPNEERNIKLNKKFITSLLLVISLCIIFFIIWTSKSSETERLKSPKIENLIGEKCLVSYGSTASPGNLSGIIKLINDKWVVILVKSAGSDSKSYWEYWLPVSKVIHIAKYHYIKK
jgi:hypothetical protein